MTRLSLCLSLTPLMRQGMGQQVSPPLVHRRASKAAVGSARAVSVTRLALPAGWPQDPEHVPAGPHQQKHSAQEPSHAG